MKTKLDCLICLMDQSLRAARLATDDEEIQRKLLDELSAMIPSLSLNLRPPEISQQGYRLIKELTGYIDPFRNLKIKANQDALKLYPELKTLVRQAEDPLFAACKLAIAGNSIDHGPRLTVPDIDKVANQALEINLTINNYGDFRDSLETARRILYIGDNAGEIVFDRILIEEILKIKAREIFFVVRGEPVINDVTLEDALTTGMDQIAQIVSSGSDAPGTILPQCSLEMQKYYHSADLIIAKGMGNFESLEGETGNLYFLLRAKCKIVAEVLGVNDGDAVLKRYVYSDCVL